MGKVTFIRNKNNAFITIDGVTRTIIDANTLLLSDVDIIKNTLERSGNVGFIKQINNSEYSYQRDKQDR